MELFPGMEVVIGRRVRKTISTLYRLGNDFGRCLTIALWQETILVPAEVSGEIGFS